MLDSSVAFAQAGLFVDLIKAGAYKAAGFPGTSLTEDQRALLQERVLLIADFRLRNAECGLRIYDEREDFMEATMMDSSSFAFDGRGEFGSAGTLQRQKECYGYGRSS